MNNTYNSARVKLTVLYFAIIFCIVVVFSSIVISTHNRQFVRFDEIRKETLENYTVFENPYVIQNIERMNRAVNDIKREFMFNVIILDLSILTASALISFYLSGRTLEPIINALHKQKKFVSDASHELRTPLTAIKTEAEVLARSKRTELEEYREFTKSLVEEVDKLSSLTENLLQIARLDNQTEKNVIEEFDTNKVVEALVERYKALASRKKVSIEFNPAETEIIAKTDKRKYERLISILLENAIKYNKHDDGSVMITVKHIHDEVAVDITDTGIGISKEDLPRIFDRFYRASEARTGEGFGLGLSIAKELAIQINAQIRVKSELGEGSTFEVRL